MRQRRTLLPWILFVAAGSGFHAIAAPTFQSDDLSLQACVQTVEPVAKSTLAIEDVGSIEDVGHLTVIEFDGDYSRELTASRQEIAAQFYASHPDEYDFLVVFSTFEFDTGGATAFYHSIRNDTSGIGQPIFDHSAAFGSAGRLQGYVDMAAMDGYSFAPGSPQYHNVLNTLAHELMHRWGAHLRFVDGTGAESDAFLATRRRGSRPSLTWERRQPKVIRL